VQFGGGYDVANIPDVVEGYAYLSCPEVQQPTVWNVQTPGQVTMMRVPIGSIENKGAYQWYSGSGPAWSSNKTDRVPIWSDPTNGVMRISETYVAGIDRYILIGQQVDRFTASDAHIGIYESETPWGPWSTVTFENAQAFGIAESGATKTVFWGISTKWSTGNDFVMVGTLPGQDEWGSVEGSFTILNLDVCSSVNWLLCDTDTKCEGVNKYWDEGACRSVKEKSLISTPNLMTNSHLITWQTESPNLPEDFVSYNTNVSRVSTGVRLFNGGIIAQETLIEPNSTYYYAYNCISSLGNVELWHYNTSHYSNTVGTISGIFTTPSSISDNRLYFKGLSDSTINHFVLKRILNNTDKSSRLKSTGIQVGIKSVGTPVNMVQ
jgi:hypothetical protein